MDKVINKAKLDELIVMIRNYYHCADLETAKEQCKKYHEFAQEKFERSAFQLVDLIAAVVGKYAGLKPDATNEDIYKVLEVLGWAVKE